jgi:hypothetical protein
MDCDKPMTPPSHPRRGISIGIACAMALVMGASAVHAAGVVVLKEWDFHRDSTAKALAYQRIIDSHGPYLRLVSGSRNVDILRSKLADRIEVPDSIPQFLVEEEDVIPMRDALAAMSRFSHRYPASAPLLEPLLRAVSAHLARFDAGEVRFEGAWIGRDQLASTLERNREAELLRRREIEQVVTSETQRAKGLVQMDDRWVTEQELRERSPAARTPLSDTLWPLLNPEIDGARMALENLSALAASQNGAAKVRTQRLATAIRNLFLAEFRLSRQIISSKADVAKAAAHERHARQWLKPNVFGTIREDSALESFITAAEIRTRSATQLEVCQSRLLAQLQEADIVTGDFHKLREHRAALILGETVRAVAARRFPSGGFTPSFPDESLAAIRREISSKQ